MGKSARVLGQDYGLSAQEMNYVLKEQGFLDGEVGDYSLTEKGSLFAKETDYHRGPGGYAHYNRDWTNRTWDEDIENELSITDEVRTDAKVVIAQTRKEHWNEIKAAREEADAIFLESQRLRVGKTEGSEDVQNQDGLGALEKGIIIGGLLIIGYGIYKSVPHIINWWSEKKSTKPQKTKINHVQAKEIICPACGKEMRLNNDEKVWKCESCKYTISDDKLKNGEVFWFCDKCESFLNIQSGFDFGRSNWICKECGFDNDITETNTDKQERVI